MEVTITDVVKMIMKATGKGYEESSKILHKVSADIQKTEDS